MTPSYVWICSEKVKRSSDKLARVGLVRWHHQIICDALDAMLSSQSPEQKALRTDSGRDRDTTDPSLEVASRSELKKSEKNRLDK